MIWHLESLQHKIDGVDNFLPLTFDVLDELAEIREVGRAHFGGH